MIEKIFLIISFMFAYGNFLQANDSLGKALFAKCAACHGANAEKKALGASQVISGWDIAKTEAALKGYKDGSYGGAMKGVMKGQVSTLSDTDIIEVAKYIHNLKYDDLIKKSSQGVVNIDIPTEEPTFLQKHWGKVAAVTAAVIVGAAYIAEKQGIPVVDTAKKVGANLVNTAKIHTGQITKLGSNLIQKITPTLARITARASSFDKESLRKNIPNKIGVYMVQLKNSKGIQYVGRAIENRDGQTTSGLRKRLFEHLRSGKFGDGAKVFFKECPTSEACKNLEAVLIKGLNPSMNKRFETIK